MAGTRRKTIFWSVFLCVSLFLLWTKTVYAAGTNFDTDMLFGTLSGMVIGWIFGAYGDEYAYSWEITDVDGKTVPSTILYQSRQEALDSAIAASWHMNQPTSLKIIEY